MKLLKYIIFNEMWWFLSQKSSHHQIITYIIIWFNLFKIAIDNFLSKIDFSEFFIKNLWVCISIWTKNIICLWSFSELWQQSSCWRKANAWPGCWVTSWLLWPQAVAVTRQCEVVCATTVGLLARLYRRLQSLQKRAKQTSERLLASTWGFNSKK